MVKRAIPLMMVGAFSSGAFAQEATQPPAEYRAVIACRAETSEAARLACFDQAVAALDQAASRGAIVVNSQQELREARRSLFGFTIPRFLGGGNGGEEEEVREIRSTVRSAGETGFQKLIITLEEGGRWQTIDGHRGFGAPRVGAPVTIRRNAFGGYMLTTPGLQPLRARRID
jgi:hypothetical protein